MEILEENGHQVIPFSIKHSLNRPTEYSSYFLEPIGKGEEIYFRNYKKNNLKDIVHLVGRLFYSFEAKIKFSQLIQDTKAELVYILCYENKISPSIINAAKKFNIPVVIRISDFGLICATNLLYSYKKNEICEKCLKKKRRYLVIYKCFHDSYLYSILKYFSYFFHDFLKINQKVDAFVIPSRFTVNKFVQYGIPIQKIFHIPTFFNYGNYSSYAQNIEYENFALYVGRIEAEKGIKTLVDAFIDTDYQLKIIGFTSTNYDEFINRYLAGKKHNISFLGKMDFNEIVQYLQKCRFTIITSEIYDNFPNAVLESFAFKKAVIATNVGSLVELVEDKNTGLLFKYRDSNDLRKKAHELFTNKKKAIMLGENGFLKLNKEFSKEKHYESLLKLFNSLR